MVLNPGCDGFNCRLPLALDLRGRLGSRVRDTKRMQRERERLQVVSIHLLHLCLARSTRRIPVRQPWVSLGDRLGLRQCLLLPIHTERNTSRSIALYHRLYNMFRYHRAGTSIMPGQIGNSKSPLVPPTRKRVSQRSPPVYSSVRRRAVPHSLDQRRRRDRGGPTGGRAREARGGEMAGAKLPMRRRFSTSFIVF